MASKHEKLRSKHKLLIPGWLLKIDHLIEAIAFPVAGLLLLIFAPHVTSFAGYLVGGAMLIFGLLMMGHAIYHREYASMDTHNSAIALTLVVCAIVVLLQHDHESCITLLGIAWGVFGIYFGVEDLNELFYNITHKKKFILLGIETVATLVLSVLLLMHPVGHFEVHVRILGVELIVASLHKTHFRHLQKTEAEV